MQVAAYDHWRPSSEQAMTPRNMEDPTNDARRLQCKWLFLMRLNFAVVPCNRRMECANSLLLPQHRQWARGGASTKKQALAEVIQRAGSTGNPVAIPITQEPDNFGPTRAIESTQRSADFWSNSVSVNNTPNHEENAQKLVRRWD